MFSFMKIATVATLALGMFVSAVPVDEKRSHVAVVEARQTQSLSSILTTLESDLNPLVAPLTSLTGTTATVDTVEGIVSDITAAVQTAINSVNALPTGALAGLDSIFSLASILNTIFAPIGSVISLPGVDTASLTVIFTGLGTLVSELLTLVLALVSGVLGLVVSLLTSLLVGLIAGITPIILELNITALISVLGI